jgi:hypothetical protein
MMRNFGTSGFFGLHLYFQDFHGISGIFVEFLGFQGFSMGFQGLGIPKIRRFPLVLIHHFFPYNHQDSMSSLDLLSPPLAKGIKEKPSSFICCVLIRYQ